MLSTEKNSSKCSWSFRSKITITQKPYHLPENLVCDTAFLYALFCRLSTVPADQILYHLSGDDKSHH